jgi:hypothetical protein
MLEKISHGNKIRIDNFLTKSQIHSDKKNFFITTKGKVISFGGIDGSFIKPKKNLL